MVQRLMAGLFAAVLATAVAGGAPAQEAADAAPDPIVQEAAATFQVIEGGKGAEPASSPAVDAETLAQFPSWNVDSASLAALVLYVEAAVDESGPGYVPEQARVAVFDMDGTFLCEKAPVYVDYCLTLHRIFDDPDYEAPTEVKAFFEDVQEAAAAGTFIDKSKHVFDKDDLMALAFAGMTPDEFHAYVNDFIDNTQAQGFSGMTYAETFYRPMLEVIDYLRANGFNVYIVSACEREVVRAIVCPRLGFAPDHVIASDWSIAATGQGGESSSDYTFQPDDELSFTGTYMGDTGKTNKVLAIQREIGVRPVLAFGNSSGDFAMLNYTAYNPEYPGMGFLVVADDEAREYGDAEKAATMYESAAEYGWTTFSMRDDWATIYGEGVEKTCLPAEEAQVEEEELSAAA